jgi:NAD(P)-dependent dehydrogenase (short-subunit alcohol dehydrogenase family)
LSTEADGDRWLLVSGGSGGIGSAVCAGLAERGIRPIVGYHRNDVAARVVAERCGGRALHLDLSNPACVANAAQELAQLPTLLGAVLAGSPPLHLNSFGKISADELLAQWKVNVLGPQQLLSELVRQCFRRRKAGAVVGVLTTAMGGTDSPAAAGMGAYVIGKHGMAGVLALLAADYPWLRVRSVKPSFTETKMLDAFDARFLDLQRAKAPFQTPGLVARQILQEALDS